MNDEWATRSRRLGPVAVLSTFAVVLLCIPSAYRFGSYAMTAAMVVGLLAMALWIGGLVVPDHDIALGSSPAQRGVLVALSLTIVSYFVATVQPLEAVAARAADRRLIGLLAVVGVALLSADGIRDRQALYRVLGVVVAAGGAMALIGILQYLTDIDVARSLRPPGFAAEENNTFVFARAGLQRVASTTRHPIEFGVVCAMLLPITLHLAAHAGSTVARRASLLAAFLLGVALPMALSRSGVLASIAVLVVVIPGMPAVRRWRFIAGAGLMAAVVVLLAPRTLTTLGELFFGDAATGSNEARSLAAQEAIDRFADRPWLGQGFGTLHDLIVDNQILVTLVESGVLGIVTLVALLNGALLAVRRARQSTDDEALRDLGRAFVAVIVAVAVGSVGLSTLNYPITSGLLFLTIGLSGALYRIAAADAVAHRPSSREDALALARL